MPGQVPQPTHADPMNRYSAPIKITDTKLARLFEMEVRRNAAKPGRRLHVAHDDRFPLVPAFISRYSYFVKFDGPGESAGNHFHRSKNELFIPILGSFSVALQDPDTLEAEQVRIDADRHEVLYVRAGVAHRVEPLSSGAILFVHATSPNTEDDEFPFEIELIDCLSVPKTAQG